MLWFARYVLKAALTLLVDKKANVTHKELGVTVQLPIISVKKVKLKE